ncbi:MAG: glycosyltransferase family 4 protein [Candidatus Hodarchaeota archaeon]
MSVLAITPFPPIISGGSKASFEILKRISKNYHVHLLSYSPSRIKFNNLEETSLHLPRQSSILRGIVFIVFGSLLSLFICIAKKPKLIYCKNLNSPGIVGFIISSITGIPLVLHTSGPDVSRLDFCASLVGNLSRVYFCIIKKLRVLQFKRASIVIANCSADEKAVKQFLRDVKVTTIYNGVDTNKFSPISSKTKQFVKKRIGIDKKCVGYTGRVDPQKNPQILLEIALSFPKYQFLFVGPSKKEMSLYGYVPSNVICTGKINNVETYLQAMDVFILPSETEGLSNSLLEAMATQICCICFPVGEVPFIINNNVNGIIVKSTSEMKSKIESVLNNLETKITIAKEARKTVLENFQWKITAFRFEKIIRLLTS